MIRNKRKKKNHKLRMFMPFLFFFRFFLSFESLLCQHYHSDLLWDLLEETEMVPVVFGGPEYSEILPPKAFIDALNYSPKTLAFYIEYLSMTPNVYRQYLMWRKRMKLKKIPWPCTLCEMLYNNNQSSLISNGQKTRQAVINDPIMCTSWPDLNFAATAQYT